MRTVLVGEKHKGRRIEKLLRDSFPDMPEGAIHKVLRKKDVRVNGVKAGKGFIVMPGDVVDIYLPDRILDGVPEGYGHALNVKFSVVYEDLNILIVNKEPGIPVHPGAGHSSFTLIDSVKDYLREKGEFDPHNPSSFAPSLCHRLDRNTGGLVIIAKNSESLKVMLSKIKHGEVRKYYQCLVKGKMPEKEAILKAYLVKHENKSRVFVSDTKVKGSVEIITAYRTLSYQKELDISRLEVELVTGRTHQIRAHLAHLGHPIIGDGKYGSNAINRPLGIRRQLLWAYKLVFDFKKDVCILHYLNGKKFEVEPQFELNV